MLNNVYIFIGSQVPWRNWKETTKTSRERSKEIWRVTGTTCWTSHIWSRKVMICVFWLDQSNYFIVKVIFLIFLSHRVFLLNKCISFHFTLWQGSIKIVLVIPQIIFSTLCLHFRCLFGIQEFHCESCLPYHWLCNCAHDLYTWLQNVKKKSVL